MDFPSLLRALIRFKVASNRAGVKYPPCRFDMQDYRQRVGSARQAKLIQVLCFQIRVGVARQPVLSLSSL